MTMERQKWILVFSFFIIAISNLRCSSESSTTTQTNPSGGGGQNAPTCTANIPASLKARSASGPTASSLEKLTLKDELNKEVYLGVFDDCGNFMRNATTAQWSRTGDVHFEILNNNSATTNLFPFRGATSIPTNTILRAETEGLGVDIPTEIRWAITDLTQHLRWYRADSLVSSTEGDAVGSSALTALEDLGPTATRYNAVVTAAGREPRLRRQVFARPVLEFCGVSSSCSGISMNSHLRIGSSFATFANTDLTFVYVLARANGNTNFILANQSAGNNTGTFLGFTSNTNFRFGLAGPGGSPQLNVTIPAYGGTPQLEIWTARLDTQIGSSTFGMQVFRNGTLLGSTTTGITQQTTATTIPFIGTQRSENNSARFYFAEMAAYTRALSDTELCPLHQFLADKYQLNINFSCP